MTRGKYLSIIGVVGSLLIPAAAFGEGPADPAKTKSGSVNVVIAQADPTLLAQATAAPAPAPAPQGEDSATLETIEVTGTRIPQANLLSSVPLQTVDSFQIELSGEANVGDIIRNLPVAGVSALTPTNSNFFVSGSGMTTVDLRNLGEDRTLVLVNGRRFVAGLPGQQVVDFNSIPADFIDKIEVITGGASAVYGSDALAGVVNIILKKDFNGFAVSGQTGQTTGDSDDVQRSVRMTTGSTFADGKGNAMFNASFNEARGVYARDRGVSDTDCFALIFLTADPADVGGCFTPTFSSFSPNTRIITPDSAGATGGIVTTNRIIDPVSGAVGAYSTPVNGFNRQSKRALSTPLERSLLASVLNYEFSPGANIFFEGTYARSEAVSDLEPFPLGSDSVFGGNLPDCTDTDASGEVDVCDLNTGVPLSSGIIPAALRADVLARNPELSGTAGDPNEGVIGFARRLTEVGNRGAAATRQTLRLVTGLDGDLLEALSLERDLFHSMRYEVSYNHGRTTDDQISGGQLNVSNLRESFNIEPDPVNPGQSRCANQTARDEGCVPTFVFGLNTITPDAVAYITAPSLRRAQIEQNVVSAFASGRIGEIPTGGPIGFSFGAEYRDESSADVPDALTQTGQNAGNKIAEQIGSIHVKEFFAEVELPVLVDAPMAEYLGFKAAARLSDYSSVGNTTAYSLAADWAFTDWGRLRGQYARAVRAPNIAELFSTGGETFATVTDPCRGVAVDPGSGDPAFHTVRQDLNNPGNVQASPINAATINDPVAVNCMLDPLVAQRVGNTGALSLTQAEAQGTGGFVGASPPLGELNEETADSVVLGFVFTPQFDMANLDALTVSVDYFDIEIEDFLGVIPRQLSLDQCYQGFDPASDFCRVINRFDAGSQLGALDAVDGEQDNIAIVRTSGIDLQASYDLDFARMGAPEAGKLLFALTHTHLLEYEDVTFGELTDSKGKVGFAEDKSLLNFVYRVGPFVANWQTTYIGESDLDIFEIDDRFAKIDAAWFHDVQLRYSLPVATPTTLVFGVDNVFDEFVQIGGSNGDLGQAVGSRTFPDVYEPFGQAWYAGVRVELQ